MCRHIALSREEAIRLKKHLIRLEDFLAQGERSLSYAHVSRHYLADLSSRLAPRSEARPLVNKLLSLLDPRSGGGVNNKEDLRQTIICLWKFYRLDELTLRTLKSGQALQGENR